MKMNVDKKTLLTLASGICGIGSVIIGLVSKEDETNEAAEKAAKIVMNNLSNNK